MEEWFQQLIVGDFKIMNWRRGKGIILKDDKVLKEFLFLNEIFCGSNDHASSYRYDFKNFSANEDFKFMRSTGVIIFTGTGSTAWVKSMNQLSP